MQLKNLMICLSVAATLTAHGQQEKTVTKADTPNSTVFTYVEEMPRAPYDYMSYIAKNIHYPKDAMEKNIEGRVMVKFIVDEEGAISDVKVIRGVYESLDKEAVRVVSSFPRWKPARQNGKPVSVYFNLPIQFRLTDDKPVKQEVK